MVLVVYVIAKMFIKEGPPPGPTAEETLLTEIRDELRRRPPRAGVDRVMQRPARIGGSFDPTQASGLG